MKKLYYLFVGIFVLGSIAITSCGSKDDGPKVSKTETLAGTGTTGKTWQLTAITVAGVNTLPSISACKDDDLYVFYSTKIAEKIEGATKCNASDPDVAATGTWTFNSDESQMTIAVSGLALSTGKIKEISSSKLIIETSLGGLIAYSYTFIAK